MAQYRARHGALTGAVATPQNVAINPFGTDTPALQVPEGASAIKQLIIGLATSVVEVASAGVTVCVRLSGDGLAKGGNQDIPVGGLTNGTTSTGKGNMTGVAMDVDIPVVPGGTITIQAAINGVDVGTPEIDVGLAFA